MEEGTFDLKKFGIQSGLEIDITLKYTLVGEINENKDNCILVLTSYSATHEDALELIPDRETFDTSTFCFIIINTSGEPVASAVASATDPRPGTHALAVSNIRAPDFARLSPRTAASSAPPFEGSQCSGSSPTIAVDSAPSAAVDEDVMTSRVPSGSL